MSPHSGWVERGMRSIVKLSLSRRKSALSWPAGTAAVSDRDDAPTSFSFRVLSRSDFHSAIASAPVSSKIINRILEGAIDEISGKFGEARLEFDLALANSCEAWKWKGEMIAYATVVGLLEGLKRKAPFLPDSREGFDEERCE